MKQVTQQDQNDQIVFVSDSDTCSSDCDGATSNIDEFVDNLKVGPFHYLLIVACGLSYSFTISNQSLGFILVTACDLNITATNRGWLGINLSIGIVIGATLFGKLSDTYGRRKVLLISTFINIIATLASALAYNYTMLAVMITLIGSSRGGIGSSVHTYVLEFFPRSSRGTAGACLSIFPKLASICNAVVALAILPRQFNLRLGPIYFTSWRIYLLIIVTPALLGFCVLLFMPNSLRFVLSQQHQKQIGKVLAKIDQINSCCRLDYYRKRQGYSTKLNDHVILDHITANSKHDNNSNFISHFRKLMAPPWRKRLFILTIIWLGYCISDQGFTVWVPTVISYYVKGNTCRYHPHRHFDNNNFSLNSMHIEHTNYTHCYTGNKLNSVIMNVLIGNLLSIPIAILVILLINRVGRKVLYFIMGLACGLCILLIVLIDTELSTLILFCIFLSLTTNTWTPGKIWSTELFSTEIRGTAISILNLTGHAGAILSMVLFAALFRANCTITLLLFAIFALVSSLATLFLPDTTNIDIR